jgi:peptidoglycan/LPS O-acetylase OafA/YrhL
VGWFLLAPKDYEELGRSVRYQVMFFSNVLFMRQDGYFDVASDLKPLLHTWSLAVEEQFYIIFPLLLTLLSSRFKHWRLALFAVLLVSFGLSVWAVAHHPEKPSSCCRCVPGSCSPGRCWPWRQEAPGA